MISSAVFGRYARALADVALENDEDAVIQRDLEVYQEIFQAVPDLLDSLDSPAVPREVKENLMSQLLERYPVCGTAANFLRVLLSHHRIRYFREIYLLYVKTVNERKGVVTAQVTSAGLLSDEQLSRLRKGLAAATGSTVNVEAQMDAELLGGLVVQVGSRVYDGSIRRQLVEMRKRLTGV